MSAQFEEFDYHDALYDGARQTLSDLDALAKDAPLQGSDIVGVSERAGEFTSSTYALEYRTTYTATLFDSISERIVGSTIPPAYLLQMIGIYAHALVDTVNDSYPHREVPVYVPSSVQLDDRMHQLWMQGIRGRLAAQSHIPLFSVAMEPHSLELARTDTDIQLQYRHTKSYVRLGYFGV